MSKQRSTGADYLVYLVVRAFVCVIQALSPNAARALARGLAWLAYHVDRRHRTVALENLARAFPGRWTDAGRDQAVRAVYRHFCTLLVEIIHLPRKLHTGNWRRHLELAGYALGLFGFATHAIARPLDNPYLDDFLRRFREATGQKVLAKKGDFDQMTTILAQGGVIATLADQDAGPRGLFVDFFGRPASTHKAVALMALEYRVPLLVIGVLKVAEPFGYRVTAGDLIRPEEYENDPDAVRAITQRFTTALEDLVRMAPEQYFWLHNRWKHQPAPKARRKAA